MGGLKQSAAAVSGLRLGGHTWRPIDSDAMRRKTRGSIVPQLAACSTRLQAGRAENGHDFAERRPARGGVNTTSPRPMIIA